jgi:feruloyl esterase
MRPETLAVLSALLLAPVTASAASISCSELREVAIPHGTIVFAREYSAGETIVSAGVDLARPAAVGLKVPDVTVAPAAMCRVAGVIRPVRRSYIRFEVWLPLSGWSGRFVQVGNGGLAGSIHHWAMATEVRDGNATAATDDGTSTTDPIAGAVWAERPESIEDWGHRAVHLTAENAKKIVSSFYDGSPAHSYFRGCSKGGHEGLMEASRYPSDFDGILAGAVPYALSRLWMVWINNWQHITNPERPEGFVPSSLLPLLANEVGRQCAAARLFPDDTFLNDPMSCPFRPAALLCKSEDTNDNCLTPEQVASVESALRGPAIAGGVPLYGGYAPDFMDPNDPTYGWNNTIVKADLNAAFMAFSEQWARGLLTYAMTPPMQLENFDIDVDSQKVFQTVAPAIDVLPDLSAFADRGGKLLVYHGWGDMLAPAMQSVRFYEEIADAQAQNASVGTRLEETQRYFRLFMVPGMGHCGGGPGVSEFGQHTSTTGATPASHAFLALQQWVEKGKAPAQLVGKGAHSGKEFTRPICAYPQVVAYRGSGDRGSAANFACVVPSGTNVK